MLLLALLLDRLIGEVKSYHPLIVFGNYANFLEQRLNSKRTKSTKLTGAIAWLLAVFPFVVLSLLSDFSVGYQILVDVIVVYFCIGLNSMEQHALKISRPLDCGDLQKARKACAMIVSRDVNDLSETEIVRATVESVLENTNDAVIASLFWYVIGGLPLVILHRLVNTLDAMWGYRNQRYEYFGKFSAIMDDLMAWPTAKITALLFALQGLRKGLFFRAIINAYQQSRKYKSLNGGWVMASGATVLGVSLGGSNLYHNTVSANAILGQGRTVKKQDILASIRLMNTSVLIWLVILFVVCISENIIQS